MKISFQSALIAPCIYAAKWNCKSKLWKYITWFTDFILIYWSHLMKKDFSCCFWLYNIIIYITRFTEKHQTNNIIYLQQYVFWPFGVLLPGMVLVRSCSHYKLLYFKLGDEFYNPFFNTIHFNMQFLCLHLYQKIISKKKQVIKFWNY